MRTGKAQKGPLLLGSLVTVQELNGDFSPTGKQYTYQITSDLGDFAPDSTFLSRYISLAATGYYFDEVQGTVSSGPITLMALADSQTDSALNLNIMTTLTYQRIKTLVANGAVFSDARSQAQREMLAAFNITNTSEIGDFTSLDLARRREGDKALAAISCLFVQGSSAGNVAELIADFQADLADNGRIDNAATITRIATAAKAVDPIAVSQNLTSRYRSVGVSFSSSDISAYIDQDGDGIIGKYEYVTTGAANSTTYTSPAYIVGAFDGTTFSTTAGNLIVNGVKVAAPASVKPGDYVSISMVSGGGAGVIETAYLSDGNRNVARYTIQNKMQLGSLVSTISNIGRINDVALSADGRTLFVVSTDAFADIPSPPGKGGLYVFDVTNPAAPVQLSMVAKAAPGYSWVGYDAVMLAPDSKIVFAVSAQGQLQAYDVSVSSSPALLSILPVGGFTIARSADGLSAYLQMGQQLYKVNISDPLRPSVTNTFDTNWYDFHLSLSPDGSHVLGVTSGGNNLEEVDLGNPGTKAYAITRDLPTNVMAAGYIGNRLLLAAGREYIASYNIANPAAPTVVAKVPTGLPPSPWFVTPSENAGIWYNPVARVAYVVVGSVLQLVDVNNPAAPVVLSKLYLPEEKIPGVVRSGITASTDNQTVCVVNNGTVMIFHVGGTP